MPRELKIKESRPEQIKNIDNNVLFESPNKLHSKAIEALKKAKQLESITKTKKIVSEDGKTIRFVKI